MLVVSVTILLIGPELSSATWWWLGTAGSLLTWLVAGRLISWVRVRSFICRPIAPLGSNV
jgi:hypothetical protein